jgi:hypothetical protein
LVAGTAVWLVVPAVVLRTIGGDCEGYWEPVRVTVDGRTFGVDPASCPLSPHEVLCVWLAALVGAGLCGLVMHHVVRRRR